MISPNYIPSQFDHRPLKSELKKAHGFVVHAISEYIHRGGLMYYKGYDKQYKTYNGIPMENYPEWIHHDEWLFLIGYSVGSFIEPNGDVLQCKGNFEKTYHAGKSKWKNWIGLNSHFLGAEVVMPGRNLYGEFINRMANEDWVSDLQYQALAHVIIQGKKDHGFSLVNVVSHSLCAGDEIRGKGKGKRDPGKYFNWAQLKKYLDELS